MIKIEKLDIVGLEPAIRGMRNPMNSWDKSDSVLDRDDANGFEYVGKNDLKLMQQLAEAGPVHAKYRRMITVYMDVTAPLYWWKEFDTYKVGTVANSCSTMHKIHEEEFTIDDFSHEHLLIDGLMFLAPMIKILNLNRDRFLETKDKKYWWQIIQLLPTSYNQKRTVMLNYEVLSNIYQNRRFHKLDEWRNLCEYIEMLPFSSIIIGTDRYNELYPEFNGDSVDDNSQTC